MDMGEIQKVLQGTSNKYLYLVSCNMLKEHKNNSVDLPESIEMIEKTESICKTISDSKKQSVSSAQAYILLQFVSNNLSCFGNVTNKNDVLRVYNKLLHP
ncbi:hypothetical protein SDC9_179622 [bioreactor metagenome]|uniref:Uncharacterized protein n=1 Tax=bioreactor metagenome TaxID=1076179 RepID=A0A645H0Z1_9ZZZZ